MNQTAVLRYAFRFVLLLSGALLLFATLRWNGLHNFTRPDVEALNTLILLVGSIYSVMYAFVIFVIWGQFVEVEHCVYRECNTLSDLLRFSHFLDADSQHDIRRCAVEYARLASGAEWEALGRGVREDETQRAFSKLIAASVRTGNDADPAMRQRVIDIARRTAESRDERIMKSLTRIPPTLFRLVGLTASVLFAMVLMYPFASAVTGSVLLSAVAVVLFVGYAVMVDTDNPFEGICNISPLPLTELPL